jgi:hypothetical protein
MLSLDDPRWNELRGGYRLPFDPRPWIKQLASGHNVESAWSALWEDLHHQGDVGEASYAAVPHIVRVYRERSSFDWNAYAIVGIIELARGKENNPELPEWLESDYFRAIRELSDLGLDQLSSVTDLDNVRAVLGVIAIARGARVHGKLLLNYSDDELLELAPKL